MSKVRVMGKEKIVTALYMLNQPEPWETLMIAWLFHKFYFYSDFKGSE